MLTDLPGVAIGVLLQIELKMPVAPSLVKMGFNTGRQALMMPSRASRPVKRAIFAACCGVFCPSMPVVILIRTTVMAQILYGRSAQVSLLDFFLSGILTLHP